MIYPAKLLPLQQTMRNHVDFRMKNDDFSNKHVDVLKYKSSLDTRHNFGWFVHQFLQKCVIQARKFITKHGCLNRYYKWLVCWVGGIKTEAMMGPVEHVGFSSQQPVGSRSNRGDPRRTALTIVSCVFPISDLPSIWIIQF